MVYAQSRIKYALPQVLLHRAHTCWRPNCERLMIFRTVTVNMVGVLTANAAVAICSFIPGGASSADAATYYVDDVGGNDVNDGLSQTAAWRSVSKVNGFWLLPGDLFVPSWWDMAGGALSAQLWQA